MKSMLLLFICGSLLIVSCNRTPNVPQPVSPTTPKALQENSSSEISLLRKGSYRDDLLTSIYEELLTKDSILKQLEENIAQLNNEKPDSLKTFSFFKNKNEDYYTDAREYLLRIKDSSLRLKIKNQIDNSFTNYNKRIAGHHNLVSLLQSKDSTLTDLHTVLKIVKTLHVMDTYQKDDMPSSRSIEKMILKFEKTIKQADTLIKKN
jgi:hypothetical protein